MFFCFYTVYMDPIVKKSDFWVIYTSQNVFYVFFKKLDVVTITRYQNTFWIFDFSLLDILPKYNYEPKNRVTRAVRPALFAKKS